MMEDREKITITADHADYGRHRNSWNAAAAREGMDPFPDGAPLPMWRNPDGRLSLRKPDPDEQAAADAERKRLAGRKRRKRPEVAGKLTLVEKVRFYNWVRRYIGPGVKLQVWAVYSELLWDCDGSWKVTFSSYSKSGPAWSRDSVSRSVRELERLGLIRSVFKSWKKGSPSVYEIVQDPEPVE